MSAVANHLTHGTASSASSGTTASVTPGANRLVLCAVLSLINGSNPNIPSISGNGITWAQVATQLFVPSQNIRISLFSALDPAPSAGAISITFGGQTQGVINWSVNEFSNVVLNGTSGSGAIVQSNTSTQNTTSTGTTNTLAAFANGGNGTFGVIGTLGVISVSAGSGFTELSNQSDGTNVLEAEWRADNATGVSWSWSNTNIAVVTIALELNALFIASQMI